jgi:hypothetical protein
MLNNLKLYFSLSDLIKDYDIENFLQDYSSNSKNYYKTDLWAENNIKYGEIIFDMEIINDQFRNYNTKIKISLLLKNEIFIEYNYNNDGCKMDFLTDKINLQSNIYSENKNILDKKINLSIEYNIINEEVYGNVKINEL